MNNRKCEKMKIELYSILPTQASEIRNTVFIKEQGFEKEFDSIDATAVHFVAFNEAGIPVGTCRVFWNEEKSSYVLGRLAVLKEFRSEGAGSALVNEALNYVRDMNGKELVLHSQCRSTGFYDKLGFTEFGEVEEEEGCPHIWMKKII